MEKVIVLALVMMMRHGEAENNVRHILAGRELEFHLTERGREQVASTADGLKSIPIDAIYTSPVIRTVETAKIVSETLGVDFVIDERLYETDMGSLVGRGYDEVIQKYGNLFLGFYYDDPLLKNLKVEKFTAIKDRIANMLDYVAEKHKHTNVLMITHLDPIKAAITKILDLKPAALLNIVVKNASLTILRHGSTEYNLIAFNVMALNRYPFEEYNNDSSSESLNSVQGLTD